MQEFEKCVVHHRTHIHPKYHKHFPNVTIDDNHFTVNEASPRGVQCLNLSSLGDVESKSLVLESTWL